MHVLCLSTIASVVLALGSPAPTSASDVPARDVDGTAAAPLDVGVQAPPPPPGSVWLPEAGVAPLRPGARPPEPATTVPGDGVAPLRSADSPPPSPSYRPNYFTPLDPRGDLPADSDRTVAGTSPRVPSPSAVPGPDRTDPRRLPSVRLELLVGPVWRIRTAEAQILASIEVGRRQGFSGIVQAGTIIAPDRDFVSVSDFPIGAGFVARRRLGQRSTWGSVGLTAGILVHRALTDLGPVHRVDPDLQVPLRFAWTAGRVGFSVALLQGFSFRTRTYERRGAEVWKRIPYRIGFAVGLHFDIGVGPARPRRSPR